jgi:hypothetical protein
MIGSWRIGLSRLFGLLILYTESYYTRFSKNIPIKSAKPDAEFQKKLFQCAHCGISTRHEWYNLAKGKISKNGINYYEAFIPHYYLSLCSKCKRYTIWLNDKIIYPELSFAPWPTQDMPRDIKDAYLEARRVVASSPKAASALLRMCLQNLMIHLGEKGKNVEHDLSNLIKKGLPKRLHHALWTAGVIGARSTRPNEITPKDDVNTAIALFNLLNMIVEATIAQQKKVKRLYTARLKAKPARKKKRTRKKKKQTQETSEVIPKPTIL